MLEWLLHRLLRSVSESFHFSVSKPFQEFCDHSNCYVDGPRTHYCDIALRDAVQLGALRSAEQLHTLHDELNALQVVTGDSCRDSGKRISAWPEITDAIWTARRTAGITSAVCTQVVPATRIESMLAKLQGLHHVLSKHKISGSRVEVDHRVYPKGDRVVESHARHSPLSRVLGTIICMTTYSERHSDCSVAVKWDPLYAWHPPLVVRYPQHYQHYRPVRTRNSFEISPKVPSHFPLHYA